MHSRDCCQPINTKYLSSWYIFFVHWPEVAAGHQWRDLRVNEMAPLTTEGQTNVPDFIEPPNWPHNSPDLNPWTTLYLGGSAAAGVSSEDWRRSSEASHEQLLGHDQSRASRWCYWTVVQTTIVGCLFSWWTHWAPFLLILETDFGVNFVSLMNLSKRCSG